MNPDPSTLWRPSLQAQPDGTLDLELHATWLQDYERCPHLWQRRYQEGWESTTPQAALNYGLAVHRALALFWAGEEAQLELLKRHFEEFPQPDDEWRTPARAAGIIREYNRAVPNPDWEVLAVEEPFRVSLGRVGRVLVHLCGTKDLRVRWHGRVWVLDWKTASMDTETFYDAAAVSAQFVLYYMAERLQHPEEDVAGVLVQRLVTRKTDATLQPDGSWKSEKGNKVRAPYEISPLRPVLFADEHLAEFRAEIMEHVEELVWHYERGVWPRHRSACTDFGSRCSFYDVCWPGAGLQHRDALLTSGAFRKRWENPLWQLQQRSENGSAE